MKESRFVTVKSLRSPMIADDVRVEPSTIEAGANVVQNLKASWEALPDAHKGGIVAVGAVAASALAYLKFAHASSSPTTTTTKPAVVTSSPARNNTTSFVGTAAATEATSSASPTTFAPAPGNTINVNSPPLADSASPRSAFVSSPIVSPHRGSSAAASSSSPSAPLGVSSPQGNAAAVSPNPAAAQQFPSPSPNRDSRPSSLFDAVNTNNNENLSSSPQQQHQQTSEERELQSRLLLLEREVDEERRRAEALARELAERDNMIAHFAEGSGEEREISAIVERDEETETLLALRQEEITFLEQKLAMAVRAVRSLEQELQQEREDAARFAAESSSSPQRGDGLLVRAEVAEKLLAAQTQQLKEMEAELQVLRGNGASNFISPPISPLAAPPAPPPSVASSVASISIPHHDYRIDSLNNTNNNNTNSNNGIGPLSSHSSGSSSVFMYPPAPHVSSASSPVSASSPRIPSPVLHSGRNSHARGGFIDDVEEEDVNTVEWRQKQMKVSSSNNSNNKNNKDEDENGEVKPSGTPVKSKLTDPIISNPTSVTITPSPKNSNIVNSSSKRIPNNNNDSYLLSSPVSSPLAAVVNASKSSNNNAPKHVINTKDKLIFKPSKEGDTGIRFALRPVGGGLPGEAVVVVAEIMENSPAFVVLGIQLGDIVIAVDGIPATPNSFPTLQKRMRGAVGGRVSLCLRRQEAFLSERNQQKFEYVFGKNSSSASVAAEHQRHLAAAREGKGEDGEHTGNVFVVDVYRGMAPRSNLSSPSFNRKKTFEATFTVKDGESNNDDDIDDDASDGDVLSQSNVNNNTTTIHNTSLASASVSVSSPVPLVVRTPSSSSSASFLTAPSVAQSPLPPIVRSGGDSRIASSSSSSLSSPVVVVPSPSRNVIKARIVSEVESLASAKKSSSRSHSKKDEIIV